jgi:hypothetical protein
MTSAITRASMAGVQVAVIDDLDCVRVQRCDEPNADLFETITHKQVPGVLTERN